MDTFKNGSRLRASICSMALLLFISCTSIRLISDYDSITDQKVTELQQDFAHYFVKMERIIGTDAARYENYVPFYDQMKANVSTLRIRAYAFDKNEIVIKSINLIDENISNLESLHKLGFKKVSEIIPIKNAFESSFTAIIKFQLALKGRDNK